MKRDMPPRTRLDPVVKLEEHRETRSLQELASANRQAARANQTLQDAIAQAARDERRGGSNAADWQLAESAHVRALADVSVAARLADSAITTARSVRNKYISVHARAEALRRVQDARQDEIVHTADSRVRKESEELFLLRRSGRFVA